MFRRILRLEPPIPENLSASVRDFICKLLIKEPRQRLGGGPADAEEVKSHIFFQVRSFLILMALRLNGIPEKDDNFITI